MIRGKNSCEIEHNVVSGTPDFFYPPGYHVGFDLDDVTVFTKQRNELIPSLGTLGGGINPNTGYTRRAMVTYPWLNLARPVPLSHLPNWKTFIAGINANSINRKKYQNQLLQNKITSGDTKRKIPLYVIALIVILIVILIIFLIFLFR